MIAQVAKEMNVRSNSVSGTGDILAKLLPSTWGITKSSCYIFVFSRESKICIRA